ARRDRWLGSTRIILSMPQRPALKNALPTARTGEPAAAARPATAALRTFAARSAARTRRRVVEHRAVVRNLVGEHSLQRFDQIDSIDPLRLDPAVGKLAGVAQLPGSIEDQDVRRGMSKPCAQGGR